MQKTATFEAQSVARRTQSPISVTMEKPILTDAASQQSASARLTGADLIADYVKRLPDKPGVYRMIGEDGEILYVGKAKSLKKRVTSYTKLGGHSNRIMRMITLTRSMEFVVTEAETESLLLEANLIKQLKPKFNVLLRDDKSFPHILIATDHEVPELAKHRGAQKRKGHYFGPFASAGAVNRTLNTLQKAFLLRSCSDSVYESRTRPCMQHQIKRCSAPCVDLISPVQYNNLVQDAVDFLKGKNRDIQETMSKQMDEAAETLDFELAASLRDRIRALTFVQGTQDINPGTVTDADVFGLHMQGGQACVQVFFFRAGQNWGNHAYFPRHDKEESLEDILGAFLAQFYDTREPPRLLLLSHEIAEASLLTQALEIRANRKVEILVPQRGEKVNLVSHAATNAKESLSRRLAESASQKRLMKQLTETLALTTTPTRIEVYDNSHISGTNALGGMIVAGEEGFRKNQYRKFNIKFEETNTADDFGMMVEVLTRRFARLVKEEEPGSDNWPGLVVIDGGKGQLNAATKTLKEAGLKVGPDLEAGEIMVISISKGRKENIRGEKRVDRTASATDQILLPGREPVQLEPRSAVTFFLQNLRDEAHRFAIGSHRAKRKKQMTQNPLDIIEGVGGKRKKALLHHFGSAKAVARAKKEDLATVEGISEALAERIYDTFHKS